MSGTIGKVTALITRQRGAQRQLLLIRHPYAGIQIPAGTIEPDETPNEAALREASEETGLSDLTVAAYLGNEQTSLPPNQRAIRHSTTIYSRPDAGSFDWAHIRRGIWVDLTGRRQGDWRQICFQEPDRVPDPQYVSMEIMGWAPDGTLADRCTRHFYLLNGDSPQDEWDIRADSHTFHLFWASIGELPTIISPQDQWLDWLSGGLRFLSP